MQRDWFMIHLRSNYKNRLEFPFKFQIYIAVRIYYKFLYMYSYVNLLSLYFVKFCCRLLYFWKNWMQKYTKQKLSWKKPSWLRHRNIGKVHPNPIKVFFRGKTYHRCRPRWPCPPAETRSASGRATAWPRPAPMSWFSHCRPCRTERRPLWILHV